MTRRLTVLIVLVVLLLAGAGGAIAVLGGAEASQADAAIEAPAAPAAIFVTMPRITANLAGPGPRQRFLALDVSLAVADPEDAAHIERAMPRILDSIQPYLRDLSATDLQGSAGLRRVRGDLLHRIRTAGRAAAVEEVLFTEILVQ